jgi:hypothetical protein
MTVYENLNRKEEVLIGASRRAESQDMKSMWFDKSRELRKKIGEMKLKNPKEKCIYIESDDD